MKREIFTNKNLFLSIVSILIIVFLLNTFYIFNPLTFRKDSITFEDWHIYKTPIEVVYFYRDVNDGWKEIVKTNHKKEMKFIIKELKKTKDDLYTSEDYLLTPEESGIEGKVLIRRVIGSGYRNLLEFNYFENGNFVDYSSDIGGYHNYIRITKELKILLTDHLKAVK